MDAQAHALHMQTVNGTRWQFTKYKVLLLFPSCHCACYCCCRPWEYECHSLNINARVCIFRVDGYMENAFTQNAEARTEIFGLKKHIFKIHVKHSNSNLIANYFNLEFLEFTHAQHNDNDNNKCTQ